MAHQGQYNYAYIFKYIIIGDMGVGKSCLLHQFTEKKVFFTRKKMKISICFIYSFGIVYGRLSAYNWCWVWHTYNRSQWAKDQITNLVGNKQW